MAIDGGGGRECPLLGIANAEIWKSCSLRDLTDVIIVLALFNFHRKEKIVNLSVISEITGISRATATRRMRRLIEDDVVSAVKNRNSVCVGLTVAGFDLVDKLTSMLGCFHTHGR